MEIPASVSSFISQYKGNTPHLVVSIDKVREKFVALHNAMPQARHHYAIKANPHPEILRHLQELGGYFECASITEIDMCLEAGAKPEDILYGNPLKKVSEITAAYARGIRQYVFDADLELEKLIFHAPGAKVICRIITDGIGAVSPLSIKFGCPEDKACEWLLKANHNGLIPYGISFHTGSQQLDTLAWNNPIAVAARIFHQLRIQGVDSMSVLNVGGGFPVSYRTDVPLISEFCEAIISAVDKAFEKNKPIIYTEPGRYMAGDAGFIIAEVVLISPCHKQPDNRWVYLDIGRYGGLVEEKIDYPILSDKTGESGPVLLAGQTCDSNDVIYTEKFNYQLPLSLRPGDRVILAHTGVYTTTYSTTLNGFPTLTSECI